MDYNKLADLLFPNVTELPADVDYLGQIAADISFNNAKRYFEL